MEKLIQSRLKELDEIVLFVKNVENKALVILQSLGWSSEKIQDESSQIYLKLQCPLDSGHYVPAENISNHYTKCKLAKSGYDKEDLLLPENCNATPKTVVIDPSIRSSILVQAAKEDVNFNRGVQNLLDDPRPTPLSANRITSTFTRDERRAMYDFVISNAPAENDTSDGHLMTKDNMSQKSQISKSVQEELAETRDLKRRRTKYKATTKSKAYTEIIRDVIDSQMASYVDMLNEKISRRSRDPYQEENTIPESNANESKRVDVKSNKYEVISQKGEEHKKIQSYENYKPHRSERSSSKRHHDPTNDLHSYEESFKSDRYTNNDHSSKDNYGENNVNNPHYHKEKRHKKKTKHGENNYTTQDSVDKYYKESSTIAHSHKEELHVKYDKPKKQNQNDSYGHDNYFTNHYSHKEVPKTHEDQQTKYRSNYHSGDNNTEKYYENYPHSYKDVSYKHDKPAKHKHNEKYKSNNCNRYYEERYKDDGKHEKRKQ